MLNRLSLLLQVVLTLAIGVWLGSLVMLLVGVMAVFGEYPRASGSDVAVNAAPVLFAAGERLQWIAGAVAVVSCVGWRFLGCSRLRKTLLWVVLSALIVSVASSVMISSQIQQLRDADQTQTPTFRQLHGASNVAYLVQLALVLGGSVLLPAAIRQESAGVCAISHK